jgi:putative oxidoreductase
LVQRLYSIFPFAWPGIGLLFLRSSVAIALLVEGFRFRGNVGWIQGAAILLSITLFAGYLTPIASATALLLHGLIWYKMGASSTAVVVVVSLDMIALTLVGPGAYSVDAVRFGRRVVVLPPR